MNKQDLINAVARDVRISKKLAGETIDSVFDHITKSLKRGERAAFVGFGSFSVRKRAPRKARNPQTGEIIRVKAKRVPYFSPGAELKKAVK